MADMIRHQQERPAPGRPLAAVDTKTSEERKKQSKSPDGNPVDHGFQPVYFTTPPHSSPFQGEDGRGKRTSVQFVSTFWFITLTWHSQNPKLIPPMVYPPFQVKMMIKWSSFSEKATPTFSPPWQGGESEGGVLGWEFS